ncbi:MAG: ShlB/FhaC/HecB family hemolysin secretion/activation protein, partial [Deltaproteobacteria bacterium]
MIHKSLITLAVFASLIFPLKTVFAANEAATQQRGQELQDQERQLRRKLQQVPAKPEIEKPAVEEQAVPQGGEKTLIQKIDVRGVSLLSKKEVDEIISPFINKELTMADMRKISDLITDKYRQKGYITSRAYLPPQKIADKTLQIDTIEGRMGTLDIRGNKYFKTAALRRKIGVQAGEPFNYNNLRADLSRINQLPDRHAKAVITPGKDPGTTDVVLNVEDRLPIHVGLNYDNFGSRYIDKNRYQGLVTDNNLLGFDDVLTLQYQQANADHYDLTSARYIVPLTEKTDIGFFAAQSKLSLAKQFEALNARGKSKFYSVYMNQNVINTENANFNLNLGFDYKDVFNFQLGQETSRDRMRVVKGGFDGGMTDRFGRSVITDSLDFGIPDFMAGLKDVDPRASRAFSGGEFWKNTLNILRLQTLPLDESLLLKAQAQNSPYTLTSTEQFQIGGIANVRGYPPAEVVGDSGYSFTAEWSVPPYGIPRDIRVPLSQGRLYDSLRFAAFYDWGNTHLRHPGAGEQKNDTLRGAGVGIRFGLPENFSIRADFAWALDRMPSDGHRFHPW